MSNTYTTILHANTQVDVEEFMKTTRPMLIFMGDSHV